MRTVLFLCGSLEPGKDGVGDYTRRIAGGLSKRGYAVHLLSLNDPFVKKLVSEEQIEETSVIPAIRLSSTSSIAARLELTRQILSTVAPHWISLQFVPYAFQAKGLPYQWVSFLRHIRSNYQWHIMFHELWIGSKSQDSLKYKLVGGVQKAIIQRVIKAVTPEAITTNLLYYQQLLQRIGFNSALLPIFSNIPCGQPSDSKIVTSISDEISRNRKDWLIAAMFGGLSSAPEIQQHFERLIELVELEDKKLLLIHLGRPGHGEPFFQNVREKNLCRFLVLGEQSASSVASFLQLADFGVSSYDADFLEKSGSVAALLYNELPVVLLKRAELQINSSYAYAKFVDDIPSITSFCQQPTEWSEQYGLTNATNYYDQLFKQES